MHITSLISSKTLSLLFALVAATLVVASISAQVHEYVFDAWLVPTWILEEFMLDQEANIPTWFSSLMLLLAASLTAMIAYAKNQGSKSYQLHWVGLALIFLGLSLDETASLHEDLTLVIQRVSDMEFVGLLNWPWVIAGIAAVIVFAMVYLRFLLHLPLGTRITFLVGGSLFIGGAIGVEMLGAQFSDWYGRENMVYQITAAVEEALEMAGAIVLNYGLMRYLATQVESVTVKLATGREPSTGPEMSPKILESE